MYGWLVAGSVSWQQDGIEHSDAFEDAGKLSPQTEKSLSETSSPSKEFAKQVDILLERLRIDYYFGTNVSRTGPGPFPISNNENHISPCIDSPGSIELVLYGLNDT